MAFPTVAATNGGNSGANTTSHTINLPTGIAAGDLLLILFAVDGNPTITWPSGWTGLFNQPTGLVARLACAYRIAAGGEGATVTVTTSASEGSAHTTYRITGWHGTSAPEATTVDNGNFSFSDPPALSPTWGAADTLWLAVVGYDDGRRTVSAYPTNYTNGINHRWNSVDGTGVGSARRALTAVSEDPGVFGLSASTPSAAATIAVRPAGAVSGPSPGLRTLALTGVGI